MLGAGAQLIQPSQPPLSKQSPGQPAPVSSFNVMQQLGYPTEKIAKDNNFRGLAVYHNVLYYTKGSGGTGWTACTSSAATGPAPREVACRRPARHCRPAPSLTYNASEGGANNPGLTPQHLHPEGFPDRIRQDRDERRRLPVRHLVREPGHALRRGRGVGDDHLRQRFLHCGRRLHHGGSAKVDLRRRDPILEPRLHPAERPRFGRPPHRSRVPHRPQQRSRRDRTSLGTGDGRAAQPDRARQP